MKMWLESAVFDPDLRAEAREWLMKRGIEPTWVPVDGLIDTEGDSFRMEVFSMDENNKPRLIETPDGGCRPQVFWHSIDEEPPSHLIEDVY